MSLLFVRRRLAVLVLLLCVTAHAAEKRVVTIIYTNDFHATVQPLTATWLADQPKVGGVRALAGWIAMLKRTQPTPFLFDSGDLFTGQAISTITKGQALVDMWRAIGFDAVCYGNHEFDYGIPAAVNYATGEPFPVLAANLFYRDGRPFAKPYAIVQRNGIRIAVIGIFGVDAVPSTGPATWKVIEAREPIPILRELVPKLRQQADLVVVLAHQGETGPMQNDAEAHPEVQRSFEADQRTVEAVPGIDVFIGGHAHRGIEVPWVGPTNHSIVVQSYGRGTTVGVLKLTLEGKKIVGHTGSLLRVMPGVFPTPAAVEAVVARAERKADEIGKEMIGTASAPLMRNYNGESPLGDLIADAMLWKGGGQIAFENAGGIRADIKPGPVTRYDLVSVMPFINTLTTANMTGKQIREVLEQSLTLKVGMLQVTGLRAEFDMSKPEGRRLLSVSVGGQPLEDNKTYKVVTHSFLAGGGDHYRTFLDVKSDDTGENLIDVIAEYVRSKDGKIEVPPGDRLVQKN